MVGPNGFRQASGSQLLRWRQQQPHGSTGGRCPRCAWATRVGWDQQRLPQAGGGQSLGSELSRVGRCGEGCRRRDALDQLPQRRHVQLAAAPTVLMVVLCTQQRIKFWVLINVGDWSAAAAQLAAVGLAGGGGGAAAWLLRRGGCGALLGLLHCYAEWNSALGRPLGRWAGRAAVEVAHVARP